MNSLKYFSFVGMKDMVNSLEEYNVYSSLFSFIRVVYLLLIPNVNLSCCEA